MANNKLSHITVSTDKLSEAEYQLLLKTTYMTLMHKLKYPKKILTLTKMNSFSPAFEKQLRLLPLTYDEFIVDLNDAKLQAFIGLMNRVGNYASAFHCKFTCRMEHLKGFHLSSLQLRKIVDITLFNEALIEGCIYVINKSKLTKNI